MAEQKEKMLRAAILISKIRAASPNHHALKIRYAKRLSDLVESFIAQEAREATRKAESDPAHLSWAQVAQAVETSKSTAFRRYNEGRE